MDPDKTLAGIRSPMTDQTFLQVFYFERFSQQRVLAQVQHAETEIIASAPVCVDLAKLVCRD
jgi:hypothetical protein